MAKVTKIPSTIDFQTKIPLMSERKKRVAAYARVSTDQEEQATSYEAQVSYYTEYIKNNPKWEFVEVYTDEGISGTSTKNRVGFKKMIEDALAGKIDLIVTKSVSRFARNTVDTLTNIRKLKDKGVEVFFQKENIYTLDAKGELLITIMSSLAQEESRSISENVTWGKRVAFSQGKVYLPYGSFLGYERGEDGKPRIVAEEADIVRLIYHTFLRGYSPAGICKFLMDMGIKSPGDKELWRTTTVISILTNEKYKGDALLQKSFIVNFLEHKSKKNEGEVPQYYVANSHEYIIPPNEWELVQYEIARRKKLGKAFSSKSAFASKVVCDDCGTPYGCKVWHSNTPNRKEIWQCNDKFNKTTKKQCQTPNLTEDEIKQKFIQVYNEVMAKRDFLIEEAELLRKVIQDTAELDEKIAKAQEEVELVAMAVKNLIQENASVALSQEEYINKYNSLAERYEKEVEVLKVLLKEKELATSKDKALETFIKNISAQPEILEEWDELIFNFMIEEARVHRDKTIEFFFYNGTKIRV